MVKISDATRFHIQQIQHNFNFIFFFIKQVLIPARLEYTTFGSIWWSKFKIKKYIR